MAFVDGVFDGRHADCHGTPTQAARKAKRAEEKRRRLETPEIRAASEAREELEKCSAERDEECARAPTSREGSTCENGTGRPSRPGCAASELSSR